jgi:hypothetical protein
MWPLKWNISINKEYKKKCTCNYLFNSLKNAKIAFNSYKYIFTLLTCNWSYYIICLKNHIYNCCYCVCNYSFSFLNKGKLIGQKVDMWPLKWNISINKENNHLSRLSFGNDFQKSRKRIITHTITTVLTPPCADSIASHLFNPWPACQNICNKFIV